MKKMKKLFTGLLVLTFCVVCSISSFAVKKPDVESTIQTVKVSQEVVKEENGKTYEEPKKTEYEYTVRGHQSSTGRYPLPENPTFILKGDDVRDLELEFTEEGIYEYTLVRESAPKDVSIPEDRIRYFGFKVDEDLNVTPYTCTDPDAEIEQHLNGINLTNTIKGSEKKVVPEKKEPEDKKPEKKEEKKKTIKERVQTNDPFNIAMWIIILVAAAAAIIVLVKKNKTTDDKSDKE